MKKAYIAILSAVLLTAPIVSTLPEASASESVSAVAEQTGKVLATGEALVTDKTLATSKMAAADRMAAADKSPDKVASAKKSPARIRVITEHVRFSESILPYQGGLFISNFGSDQMNPRADENKGYIIYTKDGATRTIVPGSGILHAPTAMVVKDRYLFVCDATNMKVFYLDDLQAAPQIVHFPVGDKVVNAAALSGNTLYITMTNPGHVYRLDISDPAHMENKVPEQWLAVPGANGISIQGNTMYVVSIPTDYATVTEKNVIYQIADINHPAAEPFNDVPALYDGVKISADGSTLYVSDWKTASLIAIDVKTKKATTIYEEKGIGPADFALGDDVVYLPDLKGSRILVIPVN